MYDVANMLHIPNLKASLLIRTMIRQRLVHSRGEGVGPLAF